MFALNSREMKPRRSCLKTFFAMPSNEQASYLDDLDALEASQQREEAFDDFNKFAHAMWPGFIDGRHHKVMAKKFEEIATGRLRD
jgi:hypothetical protein